MPTIPEPQGFTARTQVEERAPDYHIGGLVISREPTGFAESVLRLEIDVGFELQTTDPMTGYNLIDRVSRVGLVDKKLSDLAADLAAAVVAGDITQAELDAQMAAILALDAALSQGAEDLINLLIKAKKLTLPHVTRFVEQ